MKFIPYGGHDISNSDVKSVISALKENIITSGSKVREFESKINKYLDCKYSVACNSGTSALFLAMQALGIKKDDNIIMPSITFIASYNVSKLFNAKIFLADVDRYTGQMKPQNVEECCKKFNIKNIKAIVTMYNGGFPENASMFYKLKKKYNCFIIEDACHALGAYYKINNKTFKIGSCKHSDISTFSLHPLKTITTAEGGIVTTNSKKIANKLQVLRSLGITRKKKHWEYDIKNIGLNFRLNELQSALGISQLKRIDTFINKRKKIYNKYRKELNNISEIKMPEYSKSNFSSYHLFLITIKKENYKFKEKFIKFMLKNKIIVQYHYIPIYKFSVFKGKYIGYNAERYYKSTISLPIYFQLSKTNQIKIIELIKSFFTKY